ncbi:unnamed protein product [Microthlaspi erraticum]|uniref:Uncharacterized protein n=1 Tax=Microthlaspi erraticum TaxID=1685480 RepID=A0A6D2K6I3_9BRAS|nr:unnamed protein product [Microthlaspi erraticum]
MEVGESSNAAAAAAPSQGSGAALAGTVHETQNQYQQQSFVEMMNEQMGFQFMGHNHHHQPQQQQIPGDSPIAPPGASSSSTNPVTGPNPTTNNIWFP